MKTLTLHNKIKVLCVVAFIVGILCGWFFSTAASKPTEVCTEEFVVSKGDTLWDIADLYTTSEDDIRYTIYRIKEINNLDTSELQPGDVLVVPIYSK